MNDQNRSCNPKIQAAITAFWAQFPIFFPEVAVSPAAKAPGFLCREEQKINSYS